MTYSTTCRRREVPQEANAGSRREPVYSGASGDAPPATRASIREVEKRGRPHLKILRVLELRDGLERLLGAVPGVLLAEDADAREAASDPARAARCGHVIQPARHLGDGRGEACAASGEG